ncbi:MFS transporter [Streptomyces bobili]|uniref:MFS transporter n=1 Tax=Streptomyces bobili TaxID=67280 RepID=UPI00343E3E4B
MTVVETAPRPAPAAPPAVRYRDVLAVPYAGRLLVGTLIGRLPTGMAPLAILLLTAPDAGYGRAAALAALYPVANAIGGPLLGRLVDRYGQTTVLTAGAVLSSAAFLALGLGGLLWSVAAVLIAGGARPPLDPALRALWAKGMPSREHTRVALALEAATQEIIYIGGPLTVAGIAATVSAYCAVALTAVLGALGTVLVVTSPPSRVWTAGPRAGRADWLGPLRSGQLRLLYLAMVFVGLPMGALTPLAVDAAARFDDPGLSGTLPAALSLSAVLGGLAYGRRSWPGATSRHLLMLSGGFTAGWLLLPGAVNTVTVLAAVLVPGLFMAPLLGAANLAASAAAPAGTVTEANAWLVAALDVGCALGIAAAGLAPTTAVLPAGAAAATALLATAHYRTRP